MGFVNTPLRGPYESEGLEVTKPLVREPTGGPGQGCRRDQVINGPVRPPMRRGDRHRSWVQGPGRHVG